MIKYLWSLGLWYCKGPDTIHSRKGWCHITWMFLDHWSWSRSFQRNTKYQTFIFVYMQKLGYYTLFRACWNEGNLCKTIKNNYHTFRNTTCIKAIRLPLMPSNINHFHGIAHGRGCVNKSSLLSTRKWTKWKWKEFHLTLWERTLSYESLLKWSGQFSIFSQYFGN